MILSKIKYLYDIKQNKIYIIYIMINISDSKSKGLYTKNTLSTKNVSGLESEIEKINTILVKHEDDINELQSESNPGGGATLSFTFFYQLYTDTTTSSEPAYSEVSFTGEGESFSGVLTFHMSNNTFTEFTNDIITFVSFRTPPKTNVIQEGVYKETFDILLPNGAGFLSATSLYVDYGTDVATTISNARYEVTSTRGTFTGVKYAVISFNQNNNTRTVQLYS